MVVHPIIVITQEKEIERVAVQGQPRQKVVETLFQQIS
jgi:hypothetical protein